jgi:hypothetical protein
MKYLPFLIFLLSVALNANNCFGEPLQSIKSAKDIAKVESTTRPQSNDAVERFLVFYTIDYGFALERESDLDNVIFVRFENEDAQSKFQKFFSRENLKLNLGKKLYCDCVGSHYKEGGVDFYKVKEAHFFAK